MPHINLKTMVFGCPGWRCLFCDLLGIKQHAYQYNWVVSIVATEMWKFLSNSYVIITLCSVSLATTQSSIGTNVIVVTCYGNNNAWNPIGQPPYLVLYRLSCAPKGISEKSVTVFIYHLHYSVYHNSLSFTGAIALAKALQQNKSLEELKWVANWFRNVLYGQTASFHWRSYTGSNYNYIHTGMWGVDARWMDYCNIMHRISVSFYFLVYIQPWMGSFPVERYWGWWSHCTGWSKSVEKLHDIEVSIYWLYTMLQ